MRSTVLITGGAGALGLALAPVLAASGKSVRLLDVRSPERPPETGIEFVAGDVRERGDVQAALEGVDVVVHAAAWHGIHLRDHRPEDFWSLNVDGTSVVYEAAAERGVTNAVFCSTMGVYGESAGDNGPAAVRVHEDTPRRPTDIYGLSKVVGEETAAYYHRSRSIAGLALRFGMFVPEPFVRYGVRLLYGGVDERDVVSAVVCAMDALAADPGPQFRTYNIHSPLPFVDEDAEVLVADPMSVVGRHWPSAPQLLERAGAALWGPINAWFDVTRARRELGWQPRYDFDTFLEQLARSDGCG